MALQRGSTVDAEVAPVRVGEGAFAHRVERHRHELQVQCYRMVGSFEDSEDLVQETFLRARRKRDTYAGRSTFRAWLYRIATNACLDFLDRHPRRPRPYQVEPLVESQVAAHRPMEMAWLQPYPDRLLEPASVFDPHSEWHHGRWRGVATSANRQPAVAQYVERPTVDATRGLPDTFAWRAQVLDVLWVRDGRIMEITSFEPHLFPAFGMSLTM